MEPEVFTEGPDSTWGAYTAWEKRCNELGYKGPYRLINPSTCWQFVYPEGGTAAIYNAANGKGHVFVRPADSADDKL